MGDSCQRVIIEMASGDRLKLYSQITGQMERLGISYASWDSLDLGFELPAGWPMDVNAQPTLSQLIVVARKLKMQISINDLNLEPMAREETIVGERQL